MNKYLLTGVLAFLAAFSSVALYLHFAASPKQAESSPAPFSPPQGAPSIVQHFADFPSFVLRAGTVDADKEPTSNAQLCLKDKPQCFTLASKSISDGYSIFFGLNPKAEREQVQEGGSLILFSGTFFGGGSGTSTRLALLEYGLDGRISNLLPEIVTGEMDDAQVWRADGASKLPILVVAEALWDISAGESHFARHFYTIKAFLFNASIHQYVKAMEYKSSQRYNSGDDLPVVSVLRAERVNILAKLAASR